jgi:hypothetical protein
MKTKARAAFRVDNAEVLSLLEFRRATKDQSHRLYNQDNEKIIAGYYRYKSGMRKEPNLRLTMVVQSLYFHNGVSAMMYLKSWYFEDDCTRDYSTQWKPDNWLAFLKETVANGKGWHRDDISF